MFTRFGNCGTTLIGQRKPSASRSYHKRPVCSILQGDGISLGLIKVIGSQANLYNMLAVGQAQRFRECSLNLLPEQADAETFLFAAINLTGISLPSIDGNGKLSSADFQDLSPRDFHHHSPTPEF
jgi:hypothetical protein